MTDTPAAVPTYDIQNGVHCADFIGRDQITYGFGPEDVEHLIEKVLGYLQAGEVFLPDPNQPDALQIVHEGETLTFRPGAARQLAGRQNERSYLLSLTVDQEYQRWATRFVPLAGKMDIRQVIEGLPIAFSELIIPVGDVSGQGQITQRPLQNIAEAIQSHAAFVILGEPGAGKTTTQQKIAFDVACTLLAGGKGRTPLFVRLSMQGGLDPYAFLQTEWERRTGIPFDTALCEGRILILADGLNEIPRQQRTERLHAWMLFDQQYRGANQLIFSGREKDYDNELNLPRVLVEPLDETRIAEFLQRHRAEGLADLLDDPANRLNEMARNPLNLFVLVMVFLQGGKNLQVLANRGRLFESFSDYLLRNEQRWHPDALSVDTKVNLLASLAYDMQQQGIGTTFALETARQSLPASSQNALGEEIHIEATDFFRFGRGASILDPATLPDVRFYHHLLQEYFAARDLLRRFNAGENLTHWWKAPRLSSEMPETNVGEWDALPDPPATGWEVTTILACGLARDPSHLIEAVRQVNPILAGRCLDEAGFAPPPGTSREKDRVSDAVRQDLLTDIYNPSLHLRTRLQAGFVLGKIGDPRFQPTEFNGMNVVHPQMVAVPAGKYTIGSTDNDLDAYDDEKPQHTVELPAFTIGKWPVTNAEYACFMAAGGYENEQYWQTDLAKRWVRGEEVCGGKITTAMNNWKLMHAFSNIKQALEKTGNFSPDDIEYYTWLFGLEEAQYKDEITKSLAQKSRQQPNFWQDARYNNPSQPVVGITWFEANAYCIWLSTVSRQSYRLPSAAEWEAAARGISSSHFGIGTDGLMIYPWGSDWNIYYANTIEGRALKPSPVGAYTASRSSNTSNNVASNTGPYGTEDQAGNVYNWTTSIFTAYPCNHIIREDPNSIAEREVRGGSFDNRRRYVRSACRFKLVPDDFLDDVGFRVVSLANDDEL
jgi:formylglycine-generating enzyme required for sulfatase activity